MIFFEIMASQVEVLESIRDVLAGKDLGKKSVPEQKIVETEERASTIDEEIFDLTQMLNDDVILIARGNK